MGPICNGTHLAGDDTDQKISTRATRTATEKPLARSTTTRPKFQCSTNCNRSARVTSATVQREIVLKRETGAELGGCLLETNLQPGPHSRELMSVMWRIADLSRTYGDFRVGPKATFVKGDASLTRRDLRDAT